MVPLLRVTGFSITYCQSWRRWDDTLLFHKRFSLFKTSNELEWNFYWNTVKTTLKKGKKENRKNLAGKEMASKYFLMQVLSQRCLQLLLTPKHLAKPDTFPVAFNGTDQSAKCSLSPIQLSCCQLIRERGIRERIEEQELGPFKPKHYRMRMHTQNKRWLRNSFVVRKYRAVKKHIWRTALLLDFGRPCRSCTGTSHRRVSSAAL